MLTAVDRRCGNCDDPPTQLYPVLLLPCGHVLCTFCSRDGCLVCALATPGEPPALLPVAACAGVGGVLVQLYRSLGNRRDLTGASDGYALVCLLRDLGLWAEREQVSFVQCLRQAGDMHKGLALWAEEDRP